MSQGDDSGEREPVGGGDAGEAAHGIPEDVEPAGCVVGQQTAMQQKALEGNEDGDSEVAPGNESTDQSAVDAEAGEVRGMGQDDQARGDRAQAIQGGDQGHGTKRCGDGGRRCHVRTLGQVCVVSFSLTIWGDTDL